MVNKYKVLKMNAFIIADARERAVIPSLKELVLDNLVVGQINTGDYLISRKDETILACIERKTLTDFAASLKDGRYENRKKMIDLRDKTNCQLFFIVEGPAFPALTRKFARIPFASINTAMLKLMVRDKIFIIQTSDEAHTARRLTELLTVFAVQPQQQQVAAANPNLQTVLLDTEVQQQQQPVAAAILDTEVQPEATLEAVLLAQPQTSMVIPQSMLGIVKVPDDQALKKMWAMLHGVSDFLGAKLSKSFSFAELTPETDFSIFKTHANRNLHKATLKILADLASGNREAVIAILTGIPGITKSIATDLFDSAGSLQDLCFSPTLAEVQIKQKNRSISFGNTRAIRIQKMLTMKL